jgi:hypothetical protein
MAKVKYDLSGVEDLPDQEHAPVGVYRAKVEACASKASKSSGNPMLEVRWRVTHDATGKKIKADLAPIWDYPLLEHDSAFVMKRTKEFLEAIGLKMKGTLDTDKIVGKSAQIKLKSDTDQDGDYRPRIAKIMSLAEEDEEADAEEEEEEPDDEELDDEEDEEELDLDTMSRAELKRLIKDEELEIKILRKHSDDDVRGMIAEAMSEDEEAEEDEEADAEEEEEPDDDDGPDYSSLSVADLKAELKERELPSNGSKKALIARLLKDDGDSPF